MMFLLFCFAVFCIAKQPNIMFILVDDVGLGDVTPFAPPGAAFSTPYLAKWASQGVLLRKMYTAPTCTPSRASLMTGRYPFDLGLAFALLPGAVGGVPKNITMLPRLLRNGGAVKRNSKLLFFLLTV